MEQPNFPRVNSQTLQQFQGRGVTLVGEVVSANTLKCGDGIVHLQLPPGESLDRYLSL